MANGNINLKINTSRTGSGLESTIHDVKRLDNQFSSTRRTMAEIGKAAGSLGGHLGGLIKNLATGSLWMAGAQAMGIVVNKLKEHNDLMKKARLAARGLSEDYNSLERIARAYQKTVESWRKSKEEADQAEKDAIAKRKQAEKTELDNKLALYSFEKKYLQLKLKITQEQRKASVVGADELTQAKERAQVMKEEADLALEMANRDLKAAQAKKDVYGIDIANKEIELAKANIVTVAAEAEKVITDAEKRIAEENKKLADQQKKEAEAVEKKRQEEQKKTHQLRIEQIRKENEEALKKIDKEIEAAKREADILEQNAARARGGKTFGEWQRGERQLNNEKRKADNRQANVIRNAEKEIAQLERERVRFGKGFNPQRALRLAQLREFVNNQDPNNNPALKKAQALEKARADAEKKAQADIDAIRKIIEKGIGL